MTLADQIHRRNRERRLKTVELLDAAAALRDIEAANEAAGALPVVPWYAQSARVWHMAEQLAGRYVTDEARSFIDAARVVYCLPDEIPGIRAAILAGCDQFGTMLDSRVELARRIREIVA